MDKAARMTRSIVSQPSFALRLAMSILGTIGTGISGYLTYIHYRNLSSICLFNMRCDDVLSSRYATMWGIPLSLLGLLMYAFLTALALWSLQAKEERQDMLALGIYAMALAGTLFTIYLFYLEIFEIHAFCTWCIGSSIVIVAVLVLSLVNLLAGRRESKGKSRSKHQKLAH